MLLPRPSWATKHWKNTVFCNYLFAHMHLLSSNSLSLFSIFFLLPFSSLTLSTSAFSTVHIRRKFDFSTSFGCWVFSFFAMMQKDSPTVSQWDGLLLGLPHYWESIPTGPVIVPKTNAQGWPALVFLVNIPTCAVSTRRFDINNTDNISKYTRGLSGNLMSFPFKPSCFSGFSQFLHKELSFFHVAGGFLSQPCF